MQFIFSPRIKNIQFNKQSNIPSGACPAMGKVAPEYKEEPFSLMKFSSEGQIWWLTAQQWCADMPSQGSSDK